MVGHLTVAVSVPHVQLIQALVLFLLSADVVDFSSLPDGTNYAEKTVVNVAAKQIVVTTLNTNYHLFGSTR